MFLLFISTKKDDTPLTVKYVVRLYAKSCRLHVSYKDSAGRQCTEVTNSKYWSKVVRLPLHCNASLVAYPQYRRDKHDYDTAYNPFYMNDDINLSAKIIHPKKIVAESGKSVLMLMLLPQDVE